MCDTFVALNSFTQKHDLIFAKNSDREFYEAQYLELNPAAEYRSGEKLQLTYVEIDQAPKTNAVLLSRPHWIWGAEMGANEHGLVIGNEAIFSKVEASSEKGVIGMDLVRLALERSADVDEAVSLIANLIEQYGQSGNCGYKEPCLYHNSFLIADPNGALVMETVSREWVVRPVDTCDAISNLFTVENDYRRSSANLTAFAREQKLAEPGHPVNFKSVFEDPKESEFGEARRQRSRELLAAHKGSMNVDDAHRMLRDHGEQGGQDYFEPRLCLHMKKSFLDATTASWVSSLSAGKSVHWVTGTAAACTGVFKPVILEAGLPAHGTVPGEEKDNSSLWWRHEPIRNYILDAEDELKNSFYAERDTLEQSFLDRIENCPNPEGQDSIALCREKIERCWSEALHFEQKWFQLALDAGFG